MERSPPELAATPGVVASAAAGVELAPGLVVAARDEGAPYRLLRVRRPDSAATAATLAAHVVPGQFLRVEAAGEQTFFALADAPGAGDALELLIKRGGPVADALVALRPGDPLRFSDPEGDGYPLAAARGLDLVLVAAGSGIAPIRAVLNAALRRRADFGAIALYDGQRREADLAFTAEHPGWRAAGVTVTSCLSAAPPTWAGARSHVQPALLAAAPGWIPGRTAIFVCGMADLEDDVEAIAVRHGVAAERVYTNI